MANFYETEVARIALDILNHKDIDVTKCKISISVGKSVTIRLTDNVMNVEKAFILIRKRWSNSSWKTRHNKKLIYKITIKA